MNEKTAAPVEATMPDGQAVVAAKMRISYEADLTLESGKVQTVKGYIDADGEGVVALSSVDGDESEVLNRNETHSMLDTFISLAKKAKKRPVIGDCAPGCACASPVKVR